MSGWSPSWKGSKSPTKQRNYRANAPLHIQGKFLAAHLAKALREKIKKRQLRLRKGDTVKIMRGNFKGKIGKVDTINLSEEKVYVTGIELVKKDGSKALRPIHPSNLLIQELDTSDKRRIKQ